MTEFAYEDEPNEAPPAPPEPDPSGPEGPPLPDEPAAWSLTQDQWQQKLQQDQVILQHLERLAPLGELARQGFEPEPEPLPTPDFIGWEPEEVAAYLQQRDERMLAAMEASVQRQMEPLLRREASMWAQETVGNIGQSVNHEFTPDALDLLRNAAQSAPHDQQTPRFFAEHIAKIEQAAAAREREKIAAEQGVQLETLRNRAGAPNVPAGGQGVEDRDWNDPNISEAEATRRWSAHYDAAHRG